MLLHVTIGLWVHLKLRAMIMPCQSNWPLYGCHVRICVRGLVANACSMVCCNYGPIHWILYTSLLFMVLLNFSFLVKYFENLSSKLNYGGHWHSRFLGNMLDRSYEILNKQRNEIYKLIIFSLLIKKLITQPCEWNL